MATTQATTSQRGTPLPQKGASPNRGRMSNEDKQERLDALKIIPQADTIAKLAGMRFTDPNDPEKKGKLTFHQLVAVQIMAAGAEKEAKRVKDEAQKDLNAALSAAGRDSVMDGENKVTIVIGQSGARLDAKRLYELGVPEETIAKATVMGHEFSYVLVTPPKVAK